MTVMLTDGTPVESLPETGPVTATRILIIDDETQVREMLVNVLSDAGYFVLEAADGKEGLKVYQQAPTDLVITDLVMPGKDGIETVMEMRASFPDVKIIAISGGDKGGGQATLRIAGLLGAKRTLAKPFSIHELLDTVREVLAEAA
jgi:DNA-binding response OmpR family regulator